MDSPRRHHRYYDLILAAFVVVLLCSNFIGARICRSDGSDCHRFASGAWWRLLGNWLERVR